MRKYLVCILATGSHLLFARYVPMTCEKAGGQVLHPDKKNPYYAECHCPPPDGRTINFNRMTCFEKPFTPDQIRKRCDDRHELFQKERVTPKDVEDFAQSVKATNVTELFTHMKKDAKWKEFTENLVLFHDSQSNEQEAVSSEFPRRVAQDRGLLIASTAHPGFSNTNNRVPMFEADPKLGWKPALGVFKDGKFSVDSKPTGCTTCHGNPPRPNWFAYRVWPGLVLFNENWFDRKNDINEDYSKLGPVPADYAMFDKGAKYGEPGIFMGRFLNYWNFKIFENRLRECKRCQFEKLQYALVGSLMNCPDIPNFLGDPETPFRKQHEKLLGRSFSKVLEGVKATVEKRHQEKLDYAKQIGDSYSQAPRGYNHVHDNERLAGLEYLFQGNEINVRHLSLDYDPSEDGKGGEFNGQGGPEDGLTWMLCNFVPSVIESDPERLKVLGSFTTEAYGDAESVKLINPKVCEVLKEKSREVITGKKEEPVSKQAPKSPVLDPNHATIPESPR